MKAIIFCFLFSLSALADLEHREGLGKAPSDDRLNQSRACFKEMDNLGCGHPSEDPTYFSSCMEDRSELLSSNCQVLYQKLYGKKR